MSNEPSSVMNSNIGKRVKLSILFFLILTLLSIWGGKIIELLDENIFKKEDQLKNTELIISTIVSLLTSATLLFLNIGRDIDLHNFLDKKIFHVREKTGRIIQSELIRAGEIVNAENYQKMDEDFRSTIYLFYHFANKQTELKNLAFTYWEQYFVNMYVSLIAAILFIISGIISLKRWEINLFAFLPVFLLIIFICYFFSTKNSLIKKIYQLPKQQIQEMIHSEPDELKKQIESRFK